LKRVTWAGAATEFHFAGFEWHGSPANLEPALFRNYASTEGRWLTPDPLGGDVTNPQSLNRYAYALNNPTTFVDPLGLDATDCTQATMADGTQGYGCSGPDSVTVVASAGGMSFGGGLGGDVPPPYLVFRPGWGAGGGGGGGTSAPKSAPQQSLSFANCVKSGTDYFSLQHGLQAISGGRLGNSWLANAFLGNSVSSVITVEQYFSSLFSSMPTAPGLTGTASAAAGEAFSDFGATAALKRVPNITFSAAVAAGAAVETPESGAFVSLGVSASGALPLGAAAGALGNALSVFGAFKLPYDLSVASFSALACSLSY
jgi:RHS repeat-associated protein